MLRKLLYGGGSIVAIALSLVLGSAVASAHSRPVRFDPAPGSVLTTAPTQIVGWFDSAVRSDPNWTFIHVVDSQGNPVDVGDPVLSADRQQITEMLKPGLAPGLYTVTYRTWDDDDGAIFGDCYNFFVGQAAADAAKKANTRLDDGGYCQRIDTGDSTGTPVPSDVTALTKAAESGTADDFTEPESGGGSSGIPVWGLVAGIVVGVVVGGAGYRFLGKHA